MERKEGMPLWVFFGLSSINTRKGALTLFGVSLILTILCFPYSYFRNEWSWVVWMAPLPIYYWFCIRWIDKKSNWN
ncbi:MAG: hypothetical protein K9L30_00605 [Desulfobacterales bacterium]|nr:hypothetical protein [Desulfobacterales bacterium]